MRHSNTSANNSDDGHHASARNIFVFYESFPQLRALLTQRWAIVTLVCHYQTIVDVCGLSIEIDATFEEFASCHIS